MCMPGQTEFMRPQAETGMIKGEDGSYTWGYRDGERIRPDNRGRWFLDLGRKYKDIVCRDKRCFLYPYERKYVCGG